MKKNKYIASILMVSILLIASISMYFVYPSVKQNVQKDRNISSTISDYASWKLYNYNYLIDMNFKQENNEKLNLLDYCIDTGSIEGTTTFDHFISNIKSIENQFSTQTDFEYYAINHKTNQFMSNTETDLKNINTNQEVSKQYQWFVEYHFDENGKLTISKNDNTRHFKDASEGLTYNYEYSDNYDGGTRKVINPKNISIIYAVNKVIPEFGGLNTYIGDISWSDYLRYSLGYIALLSIIVFVLVLVTPYKYLKDMVVLDFFAKIKFEFMLFLGYGSFLVLIRLVPEVMSATSHNKFTEIFKDIGLTSLAPVLTPFINIIFWFVFFLFVIFIAYMIRYFFHKGFKRYFIENTCVGWIIVNSKRIVNKVINFDLDDNINKSVLKIVLFNFVIFSILSIFFVFGIFFAFIYSIIIFVLLKNKFNDIKKDYQVLLNATRKLSNGQFDIQINEDVGIFNPLKDEFSHIKEGFEKAVNEEVTSQKMKTELISNVSHDLKTPLTSIITYIDLLKNNQLSDEERQNYLHILDRNSLRLKNLIEDLFEVSKANSGDIKLDLIQVDIISLIKQAELENSDKLNEKYLEIRYNFENKKAICLLDSSKTYRIFENLIINISKYSLENTRVYIDMVETDQTIQIIFKNISKDEMTFNESKIVERFVQGDESRNTSGSGLGLAIVKSFTEIQGGTFHIEIDGDLFKSIIAFKKAG